MATPIPLIEPQLSVATVGDTRVLGYTILVSTWVVFVITINSLFSVWVMVIQPLANTPWYDRMYWFFSTIDDYIFAIWSIYIVAWWWSIISWCGLKLFRHSKGISHH